MQTIRDYGGAMDVSCDVCETALVHNDGKPPHDIAIQLTSDELERRVNDGRMRFIRGDVPLGDMLALAESDLKFTIVSYLECLACGRTWFWGLCIRGAPIYKAVDADAPLRERWEEVPPRERWARDAAS